MRLIDTGYMDAYTNMAVDEAIMTMVSKGKVPATLRFFGWKPAAISIGYFQCLDKEVDLEKCKELGVDYVRRITGGGAVFHDKEITYSICIPEKDVPKDIMQSYDLICGAIIKGLQSIGIDAKYAPLNDIIVNGKKISGNAQTRKLGVCLQHGTILIDVDVDKMFSLLKVPDEKIRDKMIATVKERVTSINKETGQSVNYNDMAIALRTGFEEQFNVKFKQEQLTDEELELAEFIKKEKFGTLEWNHKR